MQSIRRSLVLVPGLALLASCNTIPKDTLPATGSIRVDHPEIYDNAQLQTQLDTLRGQLAALGIIDTGTLSGTLGNVQGTSLSQSGFSLQAVARAMPSTVTTTPSTAQTPSASSDTRQTTQPGVTPAVPAAPAATSGTAALPAVASDAIGLIDKQMQLESQLQGYQLLLGGSDFARYTIAGQAKDRVVIGFPISIYPQPAHKNMAAEVEITYFPPNANQFKDSDGCKIPEEFSTGDEANGPRACNEQEATPTIINILPAERSYNVVGVAQRSTQFGAAAVVGTVGVGASGSSNTETQYLVAQQDTVALQGDGTAECVKSNATGGESQTDESIEYDPASQGPHCIEGSKGVRFKWQFRPVLGESFVRPGRRVTFVQLAIPNVRRPYPSYGGVVYIRKTWRPYNRATGVVIEPEVDDPIKSAAVASVLVQKNVFGHTFVASEVSRINISDLGGGSLQVALKGSYLTGATVRVGGTALNTLSPGFFADYNSLQFVTTAATLAQSGAVLVSSEGVESPLGLSSVCKSWDPLFECALQAPEPNPNKLGIVAVSVLPVSASSSLIKVETNKASLRLEEYSYFPYKRNPETHDVIGNLQQRDVDTSKPKTVRRSNPEQKAYLDESINAWPFMLSVGGKTYGFSDLPFQSVSKDPLTGNVVISVVASNDSINASPQLKLAHLFGNPEDDSPWLPFVPPGRITVAADPLWKPSKNGAPAPVPPPTAQQTPAKAQPPLKSPAKTTEPSGPCEPNGSCHYVVSGAGVEDMNIDTNNYHAVPSCKGALQFQARPAVEMNDITLVTPHCARQITLTYTGGSLGGDAFHGAMVLTLPGGTPAAAAAATSGVPKSGSSTPHFSLIRPVPQASDSGGTATITVGIQNLKDQTATVTVTGADIVAAKDGTGDTLAVQAGNQVVVTQDTNISFQVRLFSTAQVVNVTAEGKNGTVSAGILTFATPFIFSKEGGGGQPAATAAATSKPGQ